METMVDFADFLNQFNKSLADSLGSTKRSLRNTPNDTPLIITSVTLFSVLAVQFFTDADPIGKSVRFFRQLSAQVCTPFLSHCHCQC
jgi:hypothetical protein